MTLNGQYIPLFLHRMRISPFIYICSTDLNLMCIYFIISYFQQVIATSNVAHFLFLSSFSNSFFSWYIYIYIVTILTAIQDHLILSQARQAKRIKAKGCWESHLVICKICFAFSHVNLISNASAHHMFSLFAENWCPSHNFSVVKYFSKL